MIRPECYQCARCGKPWSEFYPKVTCACGCDVLKLTPKPKADAAPAPASGGLVDALGGLAGLMPIAMGLLGAVLVERMAQRKARAAEVALDDIDDAPAGWSPYQSGNGSEGCYHE